MRNQIKKATTLYLLQDLACLIAGALLTLAFAPFGYWILAILCPMVLAYFWQNVSVGRSFWRGFLFGAGLFGSGVSWIYVSIHTFGNTGTFLSSLITVLFALAMGLFFAFQGLFYTAIFKVNNHLKILFAFPATWVLFELLRSWLFTGFPWLLIGNSMIGTSLAGYAPIFSVYGMGLVTTFIASLLLFICLPANRLQKGIAAGVIVVIFVAGWQLGKISWTYSFGKPLSVALVQGNIPQSTKWKAGTQVKTMETYYNLTKPYFKTNLVFWPENAVPMYESQATPFLHVLDRDMAQNHGAILLGLPIYHPQTQQYYNGAVVMGNGFGTYLKRHLVPFGEYIPFSDVLGKMLSFMDIPMSNFSSGPSSQALLRMQNVKVALFICYESAFPLEIRKYIDQANLLATISDDAWFGKSIGPLQHEQIAQMRALETGRYLVRATNNGVTSIINPRGEIMAKLPQFKRAVLSGTVREMRGETPWMRFGLLPIWMLLILMFVWVYFYSEGEGK